MYYAYYSAPYNFIICLNGKIASTRAKEWFLRIHQAEATKREIPDEYKLDFDMSKDWLVYSIHKVSATPLYCISKQELFKLQQEKNTKVVLIVRNPYHRLVSFYYYWVVSNQQNHQGLGRRSTFTDLVENLEKTGLRDSHVIPQFRGLEDIKFDVLIEMEDLPNQFQNFLAKHTSILNDLVPEYHPINFFQRKTNAVQYKDSVDNKVNEPWNLTGHQWSEQNLCYQGNDIYSEDLLQRVYKLYELDFKNLPQYCPKLITEST